MNDLSKARATWLEVGEESAAQRIDNFLLRRLKGVPKSHVYRVLRSGEVRVNSGRVRPEYRLQVGDRIRVPPIRIAPRPALARPSQFPIVFEDAALLVIDKPAGVAVHGGSGVSYGVIESLRAARPQAKVLELAHRLDRDTSGLLILAKKRSALVELHRLLREGEVKKVYVAVVKGVLDKTMLEIRAPLRKYVSAKGERRVSVGEGGREAVTRVKALKSGRDYSVLEVRLLTGRTHQIRVHLAHAGHPILGDDKYGDFSLNHALAKQGVRRLFLHARRLEFAHPISGEHVELEAKLPDDMRAFVEQP
ncbi:MAG: RluA family pseudouridine synthase [Betaproteobacteria bacterium]|nr:MAG: RluA family pseudouridine synthase [Betaproteobacteria bacterium]TMI10287.1 MAG: RluA family pseudouridine synthase [Betaproteobacteria bacterium]